MKKRFLALFLALVMCLALLPSAASAVSINDNSVFIKQVQGSGTCTMTSSVMMLRRRAILDGDDNWNTITDAAVKSTAWISGSGLKEKFTYRGMNVKRQSLSTYTKVEDKKNYLISMLETHPEGIVMSETVSPHAVLLTDYDSSTDVFYCADPGNWAFVGKGRIKLADSSFARNGNAKNVKTQDQMIAAVVNIWCITNGTPAQPTTPTYDPNEFQIEDGVLVKYKGKGGDVVIPDGVTSIGHSAFFECTNLTSVTIPDGVTKIENSVFSKCTSLTSVSLGSGVSLMGNGVFYGCTSLTSIEVNASNQRYTSVDGILFSKNLATLRVYPAGEKGAYSIPDSVIDIDSDAFNTCVGLTSVTIPNKVTSLRPKVFEGCTSLQEVILPNNLKVLDLSAFWDCDNLDPVVVPTSVAEVKVDSWVSWGEGEPIRVSKDGSQKFHFLGDAPASFSIVPSHFDDDNNGYASHRGTNYIRTDIYYPENAAGWTALAERYKNCEGVKFISYQPGNVPTQPTTPDKPATQFSDVKAGDWFYGAVNWAVEKGITNGTGDGFSPNEDCTHDHILTFLWRAAGKPESTAKLPFTPKNGWAAGALAWAYEKGMIGADINENAACTRAEAAVYIWQAKGKPAASYDGRFTDVSKDAPYAPAVAWAIDAKVTLGNGDGTFGPSTVCNRAHIVTFLQRAFQ